MVIVLTVPFERPMYHRLHPPRLWQEDVAVLEFELLRIRITEAVVLTLPAESRKAGATGEEVRERPMQVVDRLL